VWRSRAWRARSSSGVNGILNRVVLKLESSEVGEEFMPVHRKRFRIEEAYVGSAPALEIADGAEPGPMHDEIMAELRAIRAQMAGAANTAMPAAGDPLALRQIAETQAMLETYRAQIEQCEKLKVELDLIHDAISRTKREIAVLHGKSFNGEEMAKVNGELGAVSAAPNMRRSRSWRPPRRSIRRPARCRGTSRRISKSS
jgi:hypothetical protein